jgi:hypothetical protein
MEIVRRQADPRRLVTREPDEPALRAQRRERGVQLRIVPEPPHQSTARPRDRPAHRGELAHELGIDESAYLTLALARVGTERGAETSIGPWAEHAPRGESGSSGGAGVAGFHPSARDQRQVRTLGLMVTRANPSGVRSALADRTNPSMSPPVARARASASPSSI